MQGRFGRADCPNPPRTKTEVRGMEGVAQSLARWGGLYAGRPRFARIRSVEWDLLSV